MENILKLNAKDAREFFLKQENYFTTDLPTYFNFSDLLNKVSDELSRSELCKHYSVCRVNEKQRPWFYNDVNYKILHNKNGEYAWRLVQLIHPALYVDLVHKITEEKNWKSILKKFKEFQSGIVECTSIPVQKSEEQKTVTSEQVVTWWTKTEQKSIALAMDYDYMFRTDIVDCYGAIYTHSISWALHTQEKAKKLKNRNNTKLLGVLIDKKLQGMSNGQTNGIPQGSRLMDFIAEIILCYTDKKLTEKLDPNILEKSKIIRYRDDYRIFVNSPEMGKEIVKELTDVLSEMGMRLHPEKTSSSNDVIQASLKKEKLAWVTNGLIKRNLQKQLLIFYEFYNKYPNAGIIRKEINLFHKRIEKMRDKKQIKRDLNSLISILVNIAFKNPSSYHTIIAVLSELLKDSIDKESVIKKIHAKFKKLPNTEYLDLWLQSITLEITSDFSYRGKLCEKIKCPSTKIWNSDWINGNLNKIISTTQIVDPDELRRRRENPVITSEEASLFGGNDSDCDS